MLLAREALARGAEVPESGLPIEMAFARLNS